MGKKVDLNAPKSISGNIRKNKHNNYHLNNLNNMNTSNQTPNNEQQGNQEEQKSNAVKQKATELALRAAGVPKEIAENEKLLELAEKGTFTIKMPLPVKVAMTVLTIGIPILLLMLFVVLFGKKNTAYGAVGLGGYEYYEGACSQVNVNNELISIEDYVAGVISREVGGFSDETLKAFAVSARTFIIAHAEKVGEGTDCYYQVDSTADDFQVYSETTNEKFKQIANETRGLIITVDGEISPGNYDASCIYTAAAANKLDPQGTYSDANYYIKYGEWTIGGVNFQEIPKDIASKVGTFMTYFDENQPCKGNHGGGMSQNGAYYLETHLGYSWKEIIDFYYNNQAELMSIYRGYSYSGDFPIEPTNELYSNLEFLIDESFENFLARNGSSVEQMNNDIKASIEDAGVGTREGVIAAGVSLIGSLAEMGIKLNYQWGGKYATLGTNPNWGTPANMDWLCGPESFGKLYNSAKCYSDYKWHSFDCSGFVTWAVINGMQDASIAQSSIRDSAEIELSATTAVCQPGGVLESEGHIVLVVGIDETQNKYIVAESRGSSLNTGSGGVVLSYYNFDAKGYRCSNLNDIYGD